jgi:hypothetical protein
MTFDWAQGRRAGFAIVALVFFAALAAPWLLREDAATQIAEPFAGPIGSTGYSTTREDILAACCSALGVVAGRVVVGCRRSSG